MKALENRLNKVVNTLEKAQDQNYNPITNLVLSYLLDIKNNTVPEYVMNPTSQDSSEVKKE